jgi:hypothetical protein
MKGEKENEDFLFSIAPRSVRPSNLDFNNEPKKKQVGATAWSLAVVATLLGLSHPAVDKVTRGS